MKKILCFLSALSVLALAGCNYAPGYEQTEATEAALTAYYEAVSASTSQTAGQISINITCEDTVVNKATTGERYEYTYTVDEDGGEIFDYRGYNDANELTAHYASGEDGAVYDKLTDLTTESLDSYKVHANNPISTLTMFRMDSNYKVYDHTISSIEMTEQEEQTVITVEFHADRLTELSIQNTGGLNRTITSHRRVYTIREGRIARIEIYDRENAMYEGEKGYINTDTVVEVNY